MLLAIHTASSQTRRPKLVVYLQTSIKPHALQSALAQKLIGVDVIVLGRYRDFQRELESGPDAVVALGSVLDFCGLRADLHGTRGGQEMERYVLLSIGASIDRARFQSVALGAVDLVGREGTGKFVARLLGLSAPPNITYVVKTEDLLPLLQFRSVEAVVVSEREAQGIKGLSVLDLKTTVLEGGVPLPGIAFRTPAGAQQIKPKILMLDRDANRKLEVDGWR